MLSVSDSRELQAAVLAMKAADRGLKSDINKRTVAVGNQIWRPAVTAKIRTVMEGRMLDNGVRIKGGNPPTAIAANSTKAVGRGKRLTPRTMFYAWEFGANRNKVSTYTRKNRKTGGTHKVTRHTARQLPARNKDGRVVYAAFREIGPRMISLWVQTIVRTYHDAAEGKR